MIGFFNLPLELRLEIYEFAIFSTENESQPLPCGHQRMRSRTGWPHTVTKARLVSKKFGAEFADVYYKHNTIILSLGMSDIADITTTINNKESMITGGTFPTRADYSLIQKLDLCVHLNTCDPVGCQWCYWTQIKTSTVSPLSQAPADQPAEEKKEEELEEGRTDSGSSGGGGGGGSSSSTSAHDRQSTTTTTTQPTISLPSLRSLDLRFTSTGGCGDYLAREPQVSHLIRTFAQALALSPAPPPPPAPPPMTLTLHTTQSARNPGAERLFALDHAIPAITRSAGRPLWFQCDPPMRHGGRVQRWVDQGRTRSEIDAMAAALRWDVFRSGDEIWGRSGRGPPPPPPAGHGRGGEDRFFRRRGGGSGRRMRRSDFEVVVLEVWGRETLEDWGEMGVVLSDGFVGVMEEAMAARESAA